MNFIKINMYYGNNNLINVKILFKIDKNKLFKIFLILINLRLIYYFVLIKTN